MFTVDTKVLCSSSEGTTNRKVSFVDSLCILSASLCLTSTLAIHRRAALSMWENILILFYPITLFFPALPYCILIRLTELN
jgi:hypothetical protein